MPDSRRLAAIMFADIVGYTAMMQHNEQEGLNKVRRFNQVMEACCQNQLGEILEFRGDGCLVIFDSAVKAMHAAREIQDKLQQSPQVPLRIGIHVGDIVFTNGNIYGDGVNLASRVESMGVPGSILFTERVVHDVKSHPEFEMSSLGRFQFKNVEKPMEVFALTNEGLTAPRVQDMKGKGRIIRSQQKKTGLLTLGLLAILGLAVWFLKGPSEQILPEIKDEKIAVLIFDNNTGNSELDIVGKIASDWITNRFQETGIKEIVSPQNVRANTEFVGQFPNPGRTGSSFSERTGARYWIEGDYFQKSGELLFDSKLVDAVSGKIMVHFPIIHTLTDEPLEGIEKLTDYLLAYWKMEEKSLHIATYKEVPSIEAYEYFFQAWENFYLDHEKTVSSFRKVIELEPKFYTAKLFLIQSHFNFGELAIADSLIQELKKDLKLPFQLRKVLEYFDYNLQGKRIQACEAYHEIFKLDRKDMNTNYLAAYCQLNRLNMPLRSIEYYEEVSDSLIKYDHIYVLSWRLRYLADAYRRSGQFEAAIKVFDHESRKFPSVRLDAMKAVIFASWGKYGSLDSMVQDASTKYYVDGTFLEVFLDAARVLRLYSPQGKEQYITRILSDIREKAQTPSLLLAQVLYYTGAYQEALQALNHLDKHRDKELGILSLMARCLLKMGQNREANQYIQQLGNLHLPYNRGTISYALAQIYAIQGSSDMALQKLEQSVQEGVLYMYYNFDGDPDLKSLFSHPEYKKILKMRWIELDD